MEAATPGRHDAPPATQERRLAWPAGAMPGPERRPADATLLRAASLATASPVPVRRTTPHKERHHDEGHPALPARRTRARRERRRRAGVGPPAGEARPRGRRLRD